MRRFLFLITCFCTITSFVFCQTKRKELKAVKTNSSFSIDGELKEVAWKDAVPITGLIETRPNFGLKESEENRTEIYLLYDNNNIYIGGYCHERSRDSVSRELVGRDRIGNSDYVGVAFDTYNDKINASGFYVTPYGEQYDAKYSTFGEDDTWSAVWESAAVLQSDGWTFEMRIPYSAIRFSNKENQTWGLNVIRQRQKTGEQYSWSPLDPTVNGFVNQEGLWTGIEKIEAPLRLSFSPYFSTYLNHYPYKTRGVKDVTASINGGMDV
ncbi:MAG TPA: sugar-binding protein, partial [Hanamia sp.]